MANGADNKKKEAEAQKLLNSRLQSAQTILSNYGAKSKEIADVQQKILDGEIKTNEELTKAINSTRKLVVETRKAADAAKKVAAANEDILDYIRESGDQTAKLTKQAQFFGKQGKQNLADLKSSIKQREKELKRYSKIQGIDAKHLSFLKQQIDSQKNIVKNVDEINKKTPELGVAYSAAADLADNLQSKMDGFFSKIPGGDAMQKAFGFDKISEQVNKGLVAGIDKVGQSILAGESPLTAMRAGFSAFNKVVIKNPVILVVAAIVAAGVAIKKLVGLAAEHEKKARETAEAMGISVSAGKEMVNNAYAAASGFGVQLVNAKEVLSVQQELSESLGNSSMISAEVAAQVADTGKSFGYGVKAAGELQATLQGVGMESAAAAEMQRELAAEATKAGLDTGKIVQDIAQNAKSTAKFFGGNVKALKNAAIEANKLGMSIADMASISDKLLDFENSISSQFELQAMTGKQINFDKARQLALEGDIAGATKEVLSQVGDINDFNNMSVLQRKKLADATGMEVDQLQKSLAIQSAMPNATEQQLKLLQKTGLSAEEIQNMSAEQLQNELARQQSSEKFAKSMENMKAQLSKALIPLGEAFMEIFAALSPILKVIGFLFKMIGVTMKYVGKLIKAIFVKPLERAEQILGGIGSILSGDFSEGFKSLATGLLRVILSPIQLIADIGIAMINRMIDGINLIPGVDIANVPEVDIAGNITGLATGGTVTKSGAFMVGEEGPEMVNLNAGSAVTPNNQLSGGDGVVKALETTNALLRELISAGTVVEMDGRVVAQAIRTTDSYRRR